MSSISLLGVLASARASPRTCARLHSTVVRCFRRVMDVCVRACTRWQLPGRWIGSGQCVSHAVAQLRCGIAAVIPRTWRLLAVVIVVQRVTAGAVAAAGCDQWHDLRRGRRWGRRRVCRPTRAVAFGHWCCRQGRCAHVELTERSSACGGQCQTGCWRHRQCIGGGGGGRCAVVGQCVDGERRRCRDWRREAWRRIALC